MREFQDRVAVITGGASGIGRGMAECFADAGMKLVLADVEETTLEKTAGELRARGASVEPVVCDVSKPEQVEALHEHPAGEQRQLQPRCLSGRVLLVEDVAVLVEAVERPGELEGVLGEAVGGSQVRSSECR